MVNLRYKAFVGPDREMGVEALGVGTREVKDSQSLGMEMAS